MIVSHHPHEWKQRFRKRFHLFWFLVWFPDKISSRFAALTHVHLEVQKGVFIKFLLIIIVTRKWDRMRNIIYHKRFSLFLISWVVCFRNQRVPLKYWLANFVIQDGFQDGCRLWSIFTAREYLFRKVLFCTVWFFFYDCGRSIFRTPWRI